MSINCLNKSLIIASIVGIVLSIYAYKVETTKELDENYEAMCDINEYMSCTRVLTSEYGRGFGLIHKFLGKNSILHLPNSIFGLIFYSLVIFLTLFNNEKITKLLLILTAVSNVASIYLAFILYLLRDICIVCVSTYIVNFVLLLLVSSKLKSLEKLQESSTLYSKKKN